MKKTMIKCCTLRIILSLFFCALFVSVLNIKKGFGWDLSGEAWIDIERRIERSRQLETERAPVPQEERADAERIYNTLFLWLKNENPEILTRGRPQRQRDAQNTVLTLLGLAPRQIESWGGARQEQRLNSALQTLPLEGRSIIARQWMREDSGTLLAEGRKIDLETIEGDPSLTRSLRLEYLLQKVRLWPESNERSTWTDILIALRDGRVEARNRAAVQEIINEITHGEFDTQDIDYALVRRFLERRGETLEYHVAQVFKKYLRRMVVECNLGPEEPRAAPPPPPNGEVVIDFGANKLLPDANLAEFPNGAIIGRIQLTAQQFGEYPVGQAPPEVDREFAVFIEKENGQPTGRIFLFPAKDPTSLQRNWFGRNYSNLWRGGLSRRERVSLSGIIFDNSGNPMNTNYWPQANENSPAVEQAGRLAQREGRTAEKEESIFEIQNPRYYELLARPGFNPNNPIPRGGQRDFLMNLDGLLREATFKRTVQGREERRPVLEFVQTPRNVDMDRITGGQQAWNELLEKLKRAKGGSRPFSIEDTQGVTYYFSPQGTWERRGTSRVFHREAGMWNATIVRETPQHHVEWHPLDLNIEDDTTINARIREIKTGGGRRKSRAPSINAPSGNAPRQEFPGETGCVENNGFSQQEAFVREVHGESIAPACLQPPEIN